MTAQAKILVVDDEKGVRFFLEEALTRDGHQVVAVASGEAGLERAAAEEFDLVLVDLVMEGMGGIDLLTALRRRSPETVAIVLTGHGSLETAVEALRCGAHDYLFKPVKLIELRESVRTGLLKRRRTLRQRELVAELTQHPADGLGGERPTALGEAGAPPAEPAEEQARFLRQGGLIVDLMRHVITLEGHVLEFSPTEFDLLAYLAGEAPRVVSPQELVRAVHGYESEPWEASETLRYHVHRIRQKARQATGHDLVRTVRGVGYTIGDA